MSDGRAPRFLIFGVPRSGKSRLAARIAAEHRASRLPVDSLVSGLGTAYPELGLGRKHEDVELAERITPLLREWIPHLDYERMGYVLDGYHVATDTAAELASRGLRVAALGYAAVDAGEKCGEIRRHERPGDWTAELSDEHLLALVRRFRSESVELAAVCSSAGLRYFDVGVNDPGSLDEAFAALTAGA